MAGLAFLPCKLTRHCALLHNTLRQLSNLAPTVAVGSILSLVVFYIFTWYHDSQTKAGAEWTKNHIYRRLPLACIASPWYVHPLFNPELADSVWSEMLTCRLVAWSSPCFGLVGPSGPA